MISKIQRTTARVKSVKKTHVTSKMETYDDHGKIFNIYKETWTVSLSRYIANHK